MALEYFLYNENYNNTLVARSKTTFAPLPPNFGQIYIDHFIPKIQPLYYYREDAGLIVLNDETTINTYLQDNVYTGATTPEDTVFQGQFTGFTGVTLPANYYNKTETDIQISALTTNKLEISAFTGYSATTKQDINSRVYRSGDTMTGTLCTTSNLLASGAVTGSSLSASVVMNTPILNASTSISAPLITGSTCITAPITCATARVQAPVVCGSVCNVSPIINAGSCLCSLGTTYLGGGATAASFLNVSGNTTIGGQTFLNNPSTGGTLNDYSVVWDPISKQVRTLSNTGGTACVYCYIDKRTTQANITETNATYLTASWSLPAGYYEYEFNAIYGNDTANRCAIVCFLVNGNVVGYCNLLKTNDTNAVSTAYVTQNNQLTAGTYTPSIVFRQCGGGTASIYFGTIRIQKIGETA